MLASFLGNAGRTDEALELLAKEEALVAQLPTTTLRVRHTRAGLHWSRGDIYKGQSKPLEAEAAYLQANKEFAALAADYPNVRDYRINMVQMLWSIGYTWDNAHQVSKARDHLLQAQTILQKLAADQQEDELSRKLTTWVNELLAKAEGAK
jgi:hypothetical protein